MADASASLSLGEIAFYWRMHDRSSGDDDGIPGFLPFEFTMEPALQLVIQKRNPVVLEWLTKVYQNDANVGYLQEGHALAERYGADFLRFIDVVVSGRDPAIAKVLEVGCGGAYVLERLGARGLDVAGIDPSPVAARRAAAVGFRVIPEFYPSAKLSETFDLIFHYDVLEHVEDPSAFLRAHLRNLSAGGLVIMAVPDCTESILRGDISMLIHEHLNYFDAESLGLTMRRAGLAPLCIEPSHHGNVLYGAAVKAEGAAAAPLGQGMKKFERFRHRVEHARAAFRRLIEPLLVDPIASVGFYVPLRLIPYISGLARRDGFRFFDDDPGLRGKFFQGFDAPVESFADFIRSPPSHVVIGSFAFADLIARRIREESKKPVEIMSLRDLAQPG